MTQAQVTSVVESKINRDRVGGYAIDQLWHGIELDQRWMVAIAVRDLISAGKVEITEKRQFDSVGNADTVTSYRKIWV